MLLFASIVVITKTQFRTDMGAFLPHSAPMAQQVLTEQVNKGAASRLVLLAARGAPVSVLAAVSQAMATTLRQEPAFIDVLNGDDKSFAGVQDFVWRNRYLLSPDVTADRFTVAGLHDALVNDLGLLGSDLGALVQQSLPGDPTGETMGLMQQLGSAQAPLSRDNVWVSPDGASALLLVHTKAPGFDIDAQARDLALITSAFNAASKAVPDAGATRLLESGPGVFAVRTRDITKHDVTLLSVLASAGAIALLAFAYRSPRVLLLGILPVASGALAAIAAVSLAFGFVHGVTLGFGVTLIGESIDYAIYLFTQTARGDQAHDTLARIWPTLRLGVLTSIVGFSAMLFSSFVGFAQLGLFSIAGLIVAAGTTRFVLPHLVPQNFFGEGAGILARPLLAVMRHRRRLRPVVMLAVLAGGLALLWHRGTFWDENLTDLSPIPASDQALDQTLRHDLGVPDLRYFAVFQAHDEQLALQRSEALAATLGRLVASGRLGGFDVPSAILPSDGTQKARQAALPDAPTLSTRLAQASVGLPFRADTFAPFLHDVAAAKTAPLITQASLPPALALRLGSMLVQNGGEWDVIVPLRDVADPAAVAAAIAQAGDGGAEFVDLNQASDQLLRSFQHEAVLLASIGSLAILAVLLIGLRSVARAVTVAAPLAAAVIVTAALLTLGGAKISIFEIVGFLLIVAVGSNYCLFFERADTNPQTRERAVASIALANLCTVSAYGLMSLSSIPVLHDIGKTVAIGTFLSLVFAALFSRGIEGQGATPEWTAKA
ncbi:MAG TPA: MMPL family transporter [Acidocella sp.]